jgi:hypothetical protein
VPEEGSVAKWWFLAAVPEEGSAAKWWFLAAVREEGSAAKWWFLAAVREEGSAGKLRFLAAVREEGSAREVAVQGIRCKRGVSMICSTPAPAMPMKRGGTWNLGRSKRGFLLGDAELGMVRQQLASGEADVISCNWRNIELRTANEE